MPAKRRYPEGRFGRSVRVSPDGCWLWQGSLTPRGYAKMGLNGRTVVVHRWSYEHFVGPIPEGMQLDHFACEVRHCVNPWHVRPVTARENTLRGATIPSLMASKTECLRGHPFDEANTYEIRTGGRACRACNRLRQSAYMARQRG